MNLLRGAIAAERLLRTTSSANLHSISLLQRYSLSSSTSAALDSSRSRSPKRKSATKEAKPEVDERPPPSPASLSGSGEKKSVVWPRPSEIPWQAKAANSVNLIGRLPIPVQFRTSPDGKQRTYGVILQEDSTSGSYPSSFWIPIIFEGNLAHIAACHLKENDIIFVSGQLSAETPLFNFSEGQASVQIMVHTINFVEEDQPRRSVVLLKPEERTTNSPDPQPRRSFVSFKAEEQATGSSAGDKLSTSPAIQTSRIDSTVSSWRDLLKNPKDWRDHRERKRNGLLKNKHPDFKHKESGDSLWLDCAPAWVLPGLEGLEFDAPLDKSSKLKGHKDDESWKDLVENPKNWWDNRTGKLNEKYPDFKHKEMGKALWLNGAPVWALSSLPPLKPKQTDDVSERRKWSQ